MFVLMYALKLQLPLVVELTLYWIVGGACGTSPTIVISPSGSIVITLPLVACFSITLNDDLSVASSLTSLSFQTS